MEIKSAVILPEITPNTLEFGGLDPYKSKEIFKDGSIISYLPEFESQSMTFMDSFGCVSHSFENAVEALINATINDKWLKDNVYINGHPNFSDRDLVVLSGTKPGVGNSGEKVLATAQSKGLIPQTMGDWDTTSRDTKNTVENYYLYSRTKESEEFADEFNQRYEITGTWVYISNWKQASKEGVLQVYVNAWYKNSNDIYYNPTGRTNHAVIMADYNKTQIYDTYRPEIKTLSNWEDCHKWALKINIIKKDMKKPIIKNNSLIQLVEGTGGFGLYLDGKIYVDGLANILASWLVRNNGDLNGKTRALTLEHWNMFPKYNLKNEKL